MAAGSWVRSSARRGEAAERAATLQRSPHSGQAARPPSLRSPHRPTHHPHGRAVKQLAFGHCSRRADSGGQRSPAVRAASGGAGTGCRGHLSRPLSLAIPKCRATSRGHSQPSKPSVIFQPSPGASFRSLAYSAGGLSASGRENGKLGRSCIAAAEADKLRTWKRVLRARERAASILTGATSLGGR